MLRENTPAKGEQESSAEQLERRKARWSTLRNFALAASLLVNGGLALDRVEKNYKLLEMQDATEKSGYSFSVVTEPLHHAEFTIYDRGDGVKYLLGKGQNGASSWESKFILPRGLDIPGTIEKMRSNDAVPITALQEVIDVATYGEFTTFLGEGKGRKPHYQVTYGSENVEGTMKVKQLYFDKNGEPLGKGFTETLGSLEGDNGLLDH